MQSLIEDAVHKGATIVNQHGGKIMGGSESSTLMVPAVLYPVTAKMRVYHEPQFGPLVPIVAYDSLESVLQFVQDDDDDHNNSFGQQASIFGTDADTVATVVDRFSSVLGRINLNTQCGRSPDTVPFTGRRSSAMGTKSVNDVLRELSVPTVVAYSSDNAASERLVQDLKKKSRFLQTTIESTQSEGGPQQ
jgi:glyceraldehyde-3-phosphate dehydrogenase (NADP+)